MENCLYYEVQRINKLLKWFILLFLGAIPLISYAILFYLFTFKHNPFFLSKETYTFFTTGIIVILISILIIILFSSLKLEIFLNSEGIFFRLFPIQQKFRKITFAEVAFFTVRKFNPITEYGGWGIRYSIRGNGVAYTLSGNFGLQIELNNSRKVLIGTQNPDQILSSLLSLIPSKYISNKTRENNETN